MAIGPALVGPPVPQQQGVLGQVGQALSGFGNRALGLWNQIGTDPAATRAAQVLALSMLGGHGNWKRDLSQGGLAALNTFEAVRAQQAAEAEKKRLEKKADQEKALARADKNQEIATRRIDQTGKDLMDYIEYQDRQTALKQDANFKDRQLGIMERQARAEEKRAAAAGQQNLTAGEREQARVEGFLKQALPGASDAQIYAAAKDIVDRRAAGEALDPRKMAAEFYGGLVKNVLPGDQPNYQEMIDNSVNAATAFADRFGAPNSASRLETMNALMEAIKAGQVPGPGAAGPAATPPAAPAVAPSAANAPPAPAQPAAPAAPAAPVFAPNPIGTKDTFGGLRAIQGAMVNSSWKGKTINTGKGPVQVLGYNPDTDMVSVQTPQGVEEYPHAAILSLVNKYGIQ